MEIVLLLQHIDENDGVKTWKHVSSRSFISLAAHCKRFPGVPRYL